MPLTRGHDIDTLTRRASVAIERAERLERAYEQMRACIDAFEKQLASEAALRLLSAELTRAAQVAPTSGAAIEGFARAMRALLPRGRPGGLGRARQATALEERWRDGRYMSHADYAEIEREIEERLYMRHAAGGFARAAKAQRAADGTHLSEMDERE